MPVAAYAVEVDEAAATFESFAPHYDAFTDHPAYSAWIHRLEGLARRHGLTGSRALDVGCGTGKSILPLLELGYDVVGCDAADGMLAEAARKTGPEVRLVHAAAEDLPLLGSFDYVTCLNDVCNYITDPDRLAAAFERIAANLADDGVLVFDANTPGTYQGFFAQTHWRENDAGKFVWHGSAPDAFEPNGLVEATIEIFEHETGDLWRHQTSRHVQRHYDEPVLAALLAGAGLRIDALYGQTDAGPLEQPLEPDRHSKAIYVVKHEPSRDGG
jgi:SAM-dependent methyltransferase